MFSFDRRKEGLIGRLLVWCVLCLAATPVNCLPQLQPIELGWFFRRIPRSFLMRSFWYLSLLLLFASVPLSFAGCSGQLTEDEAAQATAEDEEGPADNGSSAEEE
jgi:hypothetical protein